METRHECPVVYFSQRKFSNLIEIRLNLVICGEYKIGSSRRNIPGLCLQIRNQPAFGVSCFSPHQKVCDSVPFRTDVKEFSPLFCIAFAFFDWVDR